MSLVVIAHRANIEGADPKMENTPGAIDYAISRGLQVEVDIRYIDKKWWLGHDGADYKVSFDWMMERNHYIWWHVKNLDGLIEFNSLDQTLSKIRDGYPCPKLFYFWHQNDDYMLTSGGHIWTFPNKPIKGKNSILCLNKKGAEVPKGIYGICTDYPLDYQKSKL